MFIDEEYNYVEPSAINALVPVGLMGVVPSDNPTDLIAQPEVETILLPSDNTLPAILPVEPYSVPQKERTFAPPVDEDDDIDFVISKPDELTVLLPIELDTDKILLIDNGDVELIEPDKGRQIRLVKSRQIDLTSLDDADMKPRIKGEWDQLPTVDIATMNRFPWIDFNHMLDSTDVNRREDVIMDLLQSNTPYSDDDRYYIYHDANTNVFSIEEDPFSEGIDNLTSQILLLNAKLKVRDLSSKERSKIIKTRKLKLKELRTTFGAEKLVLSLSTKLSSEELNRLEETVITHLTEINSERDDNYYIFNDETE